MTVGERIKELRTSKGMTQKELGEKSGILAPNIRKYESSRQNPKAETLQKIANVLDVPVNYLLDEKVNLEKFDEHITDAQKYEIQMLDKGFDIDVLLDEKIELRIDEKPLSKEERKALSLFIDALKELRK